MYIFTLGISIYESLPEKRENDVFINKTYRIFFIIYIFWGVLNWTTLLSVLWNQIAKKIYFGYLKNVTFDIFKSNNEINEWSGNAQLDWYVNITFFTKVNIFQHDCWKQPSISITNNIKFRTQVNTNFFGMFLYNLI